MITTNRTIRILGRVENADQVEVNGKKVPLTNQNFKTDIKLKAGKNEISITASNAIGMSETVLQFIKESYDKPPAAPVDKPKAPVAAAPISTPADRLKILNQLQTRESRQLIDASVQVMKMAYSRVGWKPYTLPEKEQENMFQKTASGILLMQIGMDYFYKQDFAKALSAYEEASNRLPDFPYIFVRMGSIYYKMSDAVNAEKYWKKALALDPNYPDLQRYLDSIKSTRD